MTTPVRPLDTIRTPVGAWIRYADDLEAEIRELREALAAHHHNRDFALQQSDCNICRPLLGVGA